MLAKNVNGNACLLDKRGACEFFASKLAPTKSLSGQPALFLQGELREAHTRTGGAYVLQERILVGTQLQGNLRLALARIAHHQPFEFFTQEHGRHLQVQQLVGVGVVHQQVDPLVLAHGNAPHRQVEPPDVAFAVQVGEVAVVDAEYGTAQFLVSAGNGLCFIEFHNLPTGSVIQRCSLNVPGILVGWLQNIKPNLPLSMKCLRKNN